VKIGIPRFARNDNRLLTELLAAGGWTRRTWGEASQPGRRPHLLLKAAVTLRAVGPRRPELRNGYTNRAQPHTMLPNCPTHSAPALSPNVVTAWCWRQANVCCCILRFGPFAALRVTAAEEEWCGLRPERQRTSRMPSPLPNRRRSRRACPERSEGSEARGPWRQVRPVRPARRS